jgi:hypothetical protein
MKITPFNIVNQLCKSPSKPDFIAYLLIYLITHSLTYILTFLLHWAESFLGAKGFSASQEILRILWKPGVLYRIYKRVYYN